MSITVVGLGCGSEKLLTPEAADALRNADVLFIAKNYRHLAGSRPNVFIMGNMHDAAEAISREAWREADIAVGVSGDPGTFSLMPILKAKFGGMPGAEFRVIPGVGSLSCFFAKLGIPWNDVKILSGHGRELDGRRLMRAVLHNEKTVLFCDDARNPAWVCGVLEELQRDFMEDASPLSVAVGVDLSLEGEKIVRGSIPGVSPDVRGLSGHALVAIFNDAADDKPLCRPPDEDFIRTDVPMTRREVRSAILDELALRRDSVVWDVGAGTGSVAVACSALCPEGSVHAVERSPEAVKLIRLNRKKFRAVSLDVHEGCAPEILTELPMPTHAFIGGSGGNLSAILRHISDLGSGIRTCVATVTLESAAAASVAMMDAVAFRDLSVLNIAVTRSRPLGGSSLMAAQNPVTLWTAVTA